MARGTPNEVQNGRQALRTIQEIALAVLGDDPQVMKDERSRPEIRDILRVATGLKPRTDVGKAAAKAVESDPD